MSAVQRVRSGAGLAMHLQLDLATESAQRAGHVEDATGLAGGRLFGRLDDQDTQQGLLASRLLDCRHAPRPIPSAGNAVRPRGAD